MRIVGKRLEVNSKWGILGREDKVLCDVMYEIAYAQKYNIHVTETEKGFICALLNECGIETVKTTEYDDYGEIVEEENPAYGWITHGQTGTSYKGDVTWSVKVYIRDLDDEGKANFKKFRKKYEEILQNTKEKTYEEIFKNANIRP